MQSGFSTDPDGERIYPTLTTGSCAGIKFGEVVAVIQHELSWPQPPAAGVATDPIDPSDRCVAEGSVFMEQPQPEPGVASHWDIKVRYVTLAARPNVVQRARGADWLACVVGPYYLPTLLTYSGTLRGVYTTRRFPPQMAECWTGPTGGSVNPNGSPVSCTASHRAELFAHMVEPRLGSALRDRYRDDCASLIRNATRMPDPTAGGRLRVDLLEEETLFYPEAGDDGDSAVSVPATSLTCRIVTAGDAALEGPLLSLGDADVPVR